MKNLSGDSASDSCADSIMLDRHYIQTLVFRDALICC